MYKTLSKQRERKRIERDEMGWRVQREIEGRMNKIREGERKNKREGEEER